MKSFLVAVRLALLTVIVLGMSAATPRTSGQTAAGKNPPVAGRRYIELDFDWRFQKGDDPIGFHRGVDDSSWRVVQLPHDWSIEGPFGPENASGTGYAPGGIAWYRKRFQMPAGQAGRRVAVEFDGVYQNAQVWINGHLVGGRPYGYIGFQFDLTPHIDFNGENLLAVRVDHSKVADSRWYTGSGIYRSVRLRLTDPLAVAHWGTFVTTPRVSETAATVAIETTVENRQDTAAQITLRTTIVDPSGQDVATKSADASIEPQSSTKLNTESALANPSLWSVDSPALYSLRTEIIRNGEPVDATNTTFGVRTFRFDPKEGFFLNGRNMKLKGVCLHHDAGCLGAAVPVKVLERRLRLMKEIGANAVRTSHNPMAPEFLDLCDRLGLLVQDEAFDEFTPPKNKWVEGRNVGLPARFGYGEIFDDWAERDIQDMVRRDRNHPSVIMWSIGNEVDFPNDPFSHPVLGDEYRPTHPRAEELARHTRRLVRAVKELDTTRPVTAAMARLQMTNEVGVPELLDVVGYNYQENRYADDHARYPNRVIYGSENDDNYRAWLAVAENDYISGQFLWTGIDYLGEAGRWPARVFPGGVFDLAMIKKPDAWWRQALWSDKPVVYLAAGQRRGGGDARGGGREGRAGRGGRGGRRGGPVEEHWNWAEGTPVRVQCATNCPTVDIYLNGERIQTLNREDEQQGWRTAEVQFAPGTLAAVGRDGERELGRFALQTAGRPQKLALEIDSKQLAADGRDVAHLMFNIVDEKGVRVPDAEHEVTIEIAGPLKILGMDNGRTGGAIDYQDNRSEAYRGRGMAILQSSRQAGAARIRASAAGLETAEIAIDVK
jgi:beta-galactosidase